MGKGLRYILFSILILAGSSANSEQIVEWKDTSASAKLDFFLGDNRAYRCYVKDRTTFDFTVGIFGTNRYELLKREFAEKGKFLSPEELIIGFEYETIEREKRVGPLMRDWALLDYISPPPNQVGHKATISLSGGESLTFELFSQVPEWPFTTRERLKPYFYLHRNGKKLRCGGIKQLD